MAAITKARKKAQAPAKTGATGESFELYDSMTEKQLDAYHRDKRQRQREAALNDN
jgi:hypothetical protein